MDQKNTHQRIPQFQQMKKKDVKKLNLPGIKIVEIEYSSDGIPLRMTIEAADGRQLKIGAEGSYPPSLTFSLEKEPEIEIRFRLTGKLGVGVKLDETFKDVDDADERMIKVAEEFPNAENLNINESRTEV